MAHIPSFRRAGVARAVLATLAVAAALGACTPRVTTHGYVPDPEALSRIQPGVHNQLEVAQFLGTPSTTASFGQPTWLYITERTEAYAFLAPEVVDQRVVAIAFNDDGVVTDVDEYVLQDGYLVDPVTRTTPTYGKQLGLLEQLLGNIGRFAGQENEKKQPTSPIPGGP
jgi:outer membrane protein assembly factor BamE (lipoprotein component of BamABCDE complex)